MDLRELQAGIERTFGDRDLARGVPASVAWLAEEVGELAQAVRKGTHEQRVLEGGDAATRLRTVLALLRRESAIVGRFGAVPTPPDPSGASLN